MSHEKNSLITTVNTIAQQEIGVLETPSGSNSGPMVNEYLHSINLGKGKGHTGIVVSVVGDTLHIIEGNTNTSHSANGVGVFALERKIESISGGFIKYS
jgi:hypothetical protein